MPTNYSSFFFAAATILSLVASAQTTVTLTVEGPCMFDANNDGSIGSADLLDFLSAFGVSCE